MNVITLQEKLISNRDCIQTVLESLGFINIKYHHSNNPYFSFPRIGGDNNSGVALYVHSLHYECFTKGDNGNIFTLVMNTRNCSFPEALKYICRVNHFEEVRLKPPKYPFGGFYRKIIEDENALDEKLPTYPESILDQFYGVSENFFKDGIAYTIQEIFEVSFDHENNAVSMAIRNSHGKLVGVKERNNDLSCDPGNRYWSLYSYSKTSVCYGLLQNYVSIIRKNSVIIVESEKSVLQASSFGCFLCLAIGGHNLSKVQVKIILSLLVDRIILAYDEDIPELYMISEVEKLQVKNVFYKPRVGYVKPDNELMPKGSKCSPTDLGREIFQKLLTKGVVWCEREGNK